MTNIHDIFFFETCSSVFQKSLAGGVFCITDLQNENCNKGNLLVPLGCFSMRDSVNAQSVFRGLSYRTVGDICAQDFSIQTQNLWKVWIPFCWHCNYKRIYLKIAKSFWQNFRGN